jgi:hypothetical protein
VAERYQRNRCRQETRGEPRDAGAGADRRGGHQPRHDLRLSKALGTTPGLWYAMQGNFDMWQAKKAFRGRKVKRIVSESRASR